MDAIPLPEKAKNLKVKEEKDQKPSKELNDENIKKNSRD